MPDFIFGLRARKLKVVLRKFQPSRKIIAVLLAFGSVALSFYWFQWRPYEIRKKCSDPRYALSVVSGAKINEPTNIGGSSFNNLYRLCLVKHGLKPESILEPASLLDK